MKLCIGSPHSGVAVSYISPTLHPSKGAERGNHFTYIPHHHLSEKPLNDMLFIHLKHIKEAPGVHLGVVVDDSILRESNMKMWDHFGEYKDYRPLAEKDTFSIFLS